MSTKTYTIASKPILSSFYRGVQPKLTSKVLRDLPDGVRQPVQTLYLNEVMGFFLRTLIKVYSPAELSDKDRANLKRYLDKVLEAKDAIDGKGVDGRLY